MFLLDLGESVGASVIWKAYPTSLNGHSRHRCPSRPHLQHFCVCVALRGSHAVPTATRTWGGRSGRKGLVGLSCSSCSVTELITGWVSAALPASLALLLEPAAPPLPCSGAVDQTSATQRIFTFKVKTLHFVKWIEFKRKKTVCCSDFSVVSYQALKNKTALR